MAITQILKVTTKVKDGTQPAAIDLSRTNLTLNACLILIGADTTNVALQQMSNDVEGVKRDVEEIKCL